MAARFVARDAHGNSLGEQRWMDGIQPDHELATEFLLHWLRAEVSDGRLIGVGHRVVHGGTRFSVPARIDSDVADYLSRLVPLAPLHQPHNLAPIRRIAQQAGAPPQVACFDTAFHRTQPEVAQALPLPREITDRGVRRYGFHGLSYEYIASQLPAIDARAARGRTVVAHLGNGASLCGMVNGCSMASTMGFTALEGLMMGTRTGSIDPGVILYLFDTLHMNVHDVTALLYKRSGLLGVSGISSDMRVLGASENIHAREAIDLFVDQLYAKSDRWLRPSAAWTRWCLRPASARTTRACAKPCAGVARGWAWIWTTGERSTRPEDHAGVESRFGLGDSDRRRTHGGAPYALTVAYLNRARQEKKTPTHGRRFLLRASGLRA